MVLSGYMTHHARSPRAHACSACLSLPSRSLPHWNVEADSRVPAAGTQHTLSNRLIIELLSDLDLPSPTLLVPAAASKDRTLVDAVCGYHPTPPSESSTALAEKKNAGADQRVARSIACLYGL